MKRIAAVVVVLMVTVSMAVVGCSGAAKKSGGASTSGGSSSTSEGPYYIEKPYPTITPESPNEKKAVAGAQAALDTYIKNAELANKNNNRSDPIFDNKQGYKPRFVGYGFVIFSGKQPDGKWRSLDVSVFDSATQVKPMSVWERFGSADKGDGMMNDSYFAGASMSSDPAAFTLVIEPVSAGEKAAVAAVQAWAKKNLDPSLSQIHLSTYLIEWGEQGDAPNMMMSITPDGFSYNSVISWGATK